VFSDSHVTKCELATEVLRSSGKLTLRVTGSSMLPSIFPGDTLIVQRADMDVTHEGDIVLISRTGRLFAHRLVEKQGEPEHVSALTRGDSMTQLDPPVSRDEVIGRVCLIERNGKLIEPRTKLRRSQRAIATLIQRSELVARFVIGIHSMRATTSDRNS
jgi:signal peptidase I